MLVPESLMERQVEPRQFLAAIAGPGDEAQMQVAGYEQRGESDFRKVSGVIDRHIHGFSGHSRQLDTPDVWMHAGQQAVRASSPPPVLTFISCPG